MKAKPYVENVESESKDDNQLAEESWLKHKMRNDSVVVDLFQGQYKSKLVCPVCDKVCALVFNRILYCGRHYSIGDSRDNRFSYINSRSNVSDSHRRVLFRRKNCLHTRNMPLPLD